MSLVQKYSPRRLQDLWLEEDARTMLRLLLEQDRLRVLLIGGLSTGKSTVLDVLLRDYFGDHWDARNVMHINNLKEQGLQYFRQEIKIFCQTYAVTPGRKKCVVIDDLDQVPEQSQQVFRNFMDKYSHRVHFLASCSNAQKVIDNLQSRLTCVPLHPLPETSMRALLKRETTEEALQVAPDAADFLVQFSNHKAKVLLNVLEKCKLVQLPRMTLPVVQELCCDLSLQDMERFLTHVLAEGQLENAVQVAQQVLAKGFSVMDFLDGFYAFLRQTQLVNEWQKHAAIPCVCKYIAIFHNLHEDELEIVFFANQLQQCLLGKKGSF